MSAFEYVIIGGGAAGCVLANRLSAAGKSVCLLEAGKSDHNRDHTKDIHSMGGFTKEWFSEDDWALATTPQAALGDRSIVINQGKVLGGSSSINAMMHVRGNPRNFDHWNYLGNEGWSYADLLSYFKKIENFEGGDSEYHSSQGPMHVRFCPEDQARSEPFLKAAVEIGYDGPHWDYNGARQEHGAGYLQFNMTPNNHRHSAAAAYLDPIRDRDTLTVKTQASVTKIVVENGRAVGVEYDHLGKRHVVSASQEVLLTAGALQTPKLLQLSGIGNAADLEALGIPVVAHLPGVGQNLQDHLQLPVIYRTKVTIPTPNILTGNVIFIRTRAGLPAAPPDLQLNFTPAAPGPLLPVLPDFGGPVCIFLPILVQPQSIGTVSLASADPFAPPHIDPHYLEQDTDVSVFVRALEIIRQIASSAAFKDFGDFELAPGDVDLESYIRGNVSTLWHPAGTAKMGRDALAVVDPHLRVYGITGLRIADASVMPAVTSGNTHVPVLAIAEKAADLILQS